MDVQGKYRHCGSSRYVSFTWDIISEGWQVEKMNQEWSDVFRHWSRPPGRLSMASRTYPRISVQRISPSSSWGSGPRYSGLPRTSHLHDFLENAFVHTSTWRKLLLRFCEHRFYNIHLVAAYGRGFGTLSKVEPAHMSRNMPTPTLRKMHVVSFDKHKAIIHTITHNFHDIIWCWRGFIVIPLFHFSVLCPHCLKGLTRQLWRSLFIVLFHAMIQSTSPPFAYFLSGI